MRTTIEMAREAGIRDCTCNGTKGCLERFASLVRADERARMATDKSKEAMRLALEALELCNGAQTAEGVVVYTDKEITALREALAEPQEKYTYGTPLLDAMTGKANEALDKKAENARELGLDYEPAQPQRWAVFCQGCRKEWSVSYPHPGKDICVDCDDKPAQRTWVGLSDEEKRQLFDREDYQGWLDYINAIEAKLKEKNGL